MAPNPTLLTVWAAGLAGASGIPGLFFPGNSCRGQWIAAGMALAASGLGMAGSLAVLGGGDSAGVRLPWVLSGTALELELDGLSAFFLLPIFLMEGLGSLYGLSYWRQAEHPDNGRGLRFFWGTIVGGMALLVQARNGPAFLLGWEGMALSGFFLVATEDERSEAREAGWIYLFATHVATLCLFGLFALWRRWSGSWEMRELGPEQVDAAGATVFFVLAVMAFGIKAGLMPFHVWLPPSHASAPSHVSAMLSGVVIKMGIYGLVRFLGYMPVPPVGWGALLLALGCASALLGVGFALGQHDLKRLLAYHSVENIGIIVMGLGVALLGRSLGRPEWVLLGLAGALLHVWNHGFFKGLLFLCAGSVLKATGEREIDRLGGLGRRMPWTAAFFAVGAIAICGLPPLNGFVSELLVYLGLLRAASPGAGASAIGLLGVPVLAAVGALAVACFVKVYGAVFLGSPRTGRAEGARESSWTMRAPMGVLALACAGIGLFPFLVAPALERAAGTAGWGAAAAGATLGACAPLGALSAAALLLVAFGAALSLAWGLRAGSIPLGRGVTWDCGYARPTARMQYTASSFAAPIVGLLAWALRPRRHAPRLRGLFPGASRADSHVDDVVMARILLPFFGRIRRRLDRLRASRRSLVQHYLLYGVLTLVVLMLWITPWGNLFRRLFAR